MTSTPLRIRLRDSALRVVQRAGGLNLTSASRWRSRRLLILCYHGFSLIDEHLWNPQLYVPGSHLEARLRFLVDHGYAVVPLAEGLVRLSAGSLPRRAVAITVDDGTYDFYAVGYPIFRRMGIPVTVYVSTYYVFDERPVFDVALSYLLWKAAADGPLVVRDPAGNAPLRISRQSDYVAAATRIRDTARSEKWSADRKHQCLAQLASDQGLDWDGFLRRRMLRLMVPEELAALDRTLIDVQLHTHRHRVPEDRDLFLQEIRDNRRSLADCGCDPARLKHFCYPSGVHRPAFLPWLTEAGIISAVIGRPGLASPRDPALLMPRFMDTTSTAEVEFEGWASGFRHLVHRPSLRAP